MSLSVGPPYTLRLKVKFYSSEPNTLREELTRYQFFLQMKQDMLEGKVECNDRRGIEMCALSLQCNYTHTSNWARLIEIDRLTVSATIH